jgi:hypothetical protein
MQQNKRELTAVMKDEPCTRDHLVAIVPAFAYWSVDDEGAAIYEVTDYDDAPGDIEEYVCQNCQVIFCPDEPNHIDAAWQEALDHLKGEQVAA